MGAAIRRYDAWEADARAEEARRVTGKIAASREWATEQQKARRRTETVAVGRVERLLKARD